MDKFELIEIIKSFKCEVPVCDEQSNWIGQEDYTIKAPKQLAEYLIENGIFLQNK